MQLTKEQIDAAVAWWIEAFRHPKFDNLGPRRPEEDPRQRHRDELSGIMAMAIPRKDTDKAQAFGDALRARLTTCPEAPYCLGVDYGPDLFLHETLKEAGIDPGITSLPWKTVMWFPKGGVQVRCGYGAQEQELLTPKGA